jgi:4-amino-4-deoxy-L-arabinose transferase-like glycosyltransferase
VLRHAAMTVAEPTAAASAGGPESSLERSWQLRVAGRGLVVRPPHIALAVVLVISALLEGHGISHNGFANNYYSAAVKAMLGSLHNFFFVSSDPGGLVSVDKPPLGLWLQVLSAKLLGFRELAILIPEAACGFLTVVLSYFIVAPRFGRWAGVAAAAALAVFPAFVASTRDNNLDALLILLMLLAGWATVKAIENDKLWMLLLAALLAGLAFNTKALAAYLVVPGMALAYLVCADGSLQRRVARLLAAGVVLAVVSLVWIVAVDLVPASQRPYVGGTTDNSELSLTFEYNGFGRVAGEVGGSGQSFAAGAIGGSVLHPAPGANSILGPRLKALEIPGPTGASGTTGASATHELTQTGIFKGTTGVTVIPLTYGQTASEAAGQAPAPPLPVDHRSYIPIALGPAPGVLRLFGTGFGDQAAWILPLALFGLVALVLLLFRAGAWRRDRRLSVLLVFGGWFVTEAVVLSASSGIVHPYYTSALGPGTAIVAGCGAAAFVALARRNRRYLALPVLALASTIAVQIYLLHEQFNYLKWLWPLLIIAAVACVALLWLRPRWTPWLVAASFVAMLIAPALFSKTVWEVPVDGTFPAAGPYVDAGQGGVGAAAPTLPIFHQLFGYIDPRAPKARWALLTQASITAAPMILLGYRAAAMGGYGTQTPAVSPGELARFVRRGKARFVLLGGAYAWRGGNAASEAVKQVCAIIPPELWRPPTNIGTPAHQILFYPVGSQNYTLYDCRGDAAGLARA